MTLAAIARKDGFEVFTHPRRIKGKLATHVA
jgi:formate dehydrogenase assembly factor FdhD